LPTDSNHVLLVRFKIKGRDASLV